MQDLLRDRVVQAVAQADRDGLDGLPRFAAAEQAMPEHPRVLEVADIDLILGRHRRLAQDAGYRMGLEHGRSQGSVETGALLSHRVEAAATQLIGRLNVVIGEASASLAQDKVKRATMRQQVEEALVGIVNVRALLAELASLIWGGEA